MGIKLTTLAWESKIIIMHHTNDGGKDRERKREREERERERGREVEGVWGRDYYHAFSSHTYTHML